MEQLVLKDLRNPMSYILTIGQELENHNLENADIFTANKSKIVQGTTEFVDDQLTLSFNLSLVGFNYEGVHLRTIIEVVEYMIDTITENLSDGKPEKSKVDATPVVVKAEEDQPTLLKDTDSDQVNIDSTEQTI
jgi:hypothetical protein